MPKKQIMKIICITIFPELYTSFLESSLIHRAQKNKLLKFALVTPRSYTTDRHQTVDDVPYGGGVWLLFKAKPMIDTVLDAIKTAKLKKTQKTRKIVMVSPSETMFDQHVAEGFSKLDTIIFVSSRYEWIDYRFEQYMQKNYPKHFVKCSLGRFVTMGGETPSMVMIEAITRLIPGVIKEEESHINESYSTQFDMSNLEHPHYTRPEEVYGMKVPETLLSGHHKNIETRRQKHTKFVKKAS